MAVISAFIPKNYILSSDGEDVLAVYLAKMKNNISCSFNKKGVCLSSVHNFGNIYKNLYSYETAQKIYKDYIDWIESN